MMTDFLPDITLTRAMVEPTLFGKVFGAASFWPWKVVAKVIDRIPLTEPREIELFKQCTGRTKLLSTTALSEPKLRRIIIEVGRRGGKDRFLSAVAVWRCALCTDWRRYLSPGEQMAVILLGRDKKQASILRRYCSGLLQQPDLQREVVRETNEIITFRNGSTLEIASNDVALVRGRSAIAVLGSEAAHWKFDDHSASSDEEVVGAAEPSMAMCPDGGLLILGSSVYRKRGFMYRMFRELHGNDDSDDICWFAPSKVMNPKLPQSVIDAAMAKDPHIAGAEFKNIHREDLSDFIPLDVIEDCIAWNVYERPPEPGVFYVAFFDAAGGTGSDSFTLAIAHCLNDSDRTVVIDVLRERKPRFVPADVIAEFSQLLKMYNVGEVVGDKFGGGFCSDEWIRNNINFRAAQYTTSENYLRALPMFLSKRAKLINSSTLRNQLASLERSTSGAHETVAHPKVASAHDDCACAVCGALVIAGDRFGFDYEYPFGGRPDRDETKQTKAQAESDANFRWRLNNYFNAVGVPYHWR